MTDLNPSNLDLNQSPTEQADLPGMVAREIDKLSLAKRMKLKPKTKLRLQILMFIYIIALIATAMFLDMDLNRSATFGVYLPYVVVFAFIFQTLDSAAGMGFGTALSPLLLLVFGFSPLTVVPALLITQTITGLITGWMHNEFGNMEISLKRPFNKETRAMFLIAIISALGTIASVLFSYFAIQFDESIITTYVTILVFVMAVFTLLRRYFKTAAHTQYRPKRLYIFAAIAGFNKGIGGGGYGPVATMGQLFAGMYEKTAAAVTSLAEGLASLVGVIAYFALVAVGVHIDFMLLPSLLAGSILAAVIAPYTVRVIPNRIYQYVIPGYALAIGIFLLLALFFI